jgi:hypothetical protein
MGDDRWMGGGCKRARRYVAPSTPRNLGLFVGASNPKAAMRARFEAMQW